MKLYYKDFEVEGSNMEINQFIRDNTQVTVSNACETVFGPSRLPKAEDFEGFEGWRRDDIINKQLINFFELRDFICKEYDTLKKKKVETEKQKITHATSLYLAALNSRLDLLETLKKMAFNEKEKNDDK